MKIKITFTKEHIALIKALNFQRIDVDEILKSFDQYNTKVDIVQNVDAMAYGIERRVIHDAKRIIQANKLSHEKISVEEHFKDKFVPDYKDIVKSNVESCTLGDIFDTYRINIDSIYGIDNYNLWGGTYIWEQMAYILGLNDHVIKGTEEDPLGPRYPEEDMEHMKDLACFIITHLKNIVDILLQYCTEGIQEGVTYWCYDYEGIWHKEENK